LNKSICVHCGELIRKHSYKGWYHPDGKGQGRRDHRPEPNLKIESSDPYVSLDEVEKCEKCGSTLIRERTRGRVSRVRFHCPTGTCPVDFKEVKYIQGGSRSRPYMSRTVLCVV